MDPVEVRRQILEIEDKLKRNQYVLDTLPQIEVVKGILFILAYIVEVYNESKAGQALQARYKEDIALDYTSIRLPMPNLLPTMGEDLVIVEDHESNQILEELNTIHGSKPNYWNPCRPLLPIDANPLFERGLSPDHLNAAWVQLVNNNLVDMTKLWESYFEKLEEPNELIKLV